MSKKHVHFIGIAGKAMAPLAKMFKDQGWRVTGSDHTKTYPPISTYLQENRIDYCQGYSAKNIVGRPDLVVVGRSALLVDPKNPEYLKAKRMGLKILSFPEVLRNYLIKKNSIVVAGTYGKTTISGLLAWILEKAGLNPSFMIGGVPLNFPDGTRNTDSNWSVVEGDEPPAMRETDLPKFMFYKPKYLLLTACQWDHPEIFDTEEDYLEAFIKLVRLLPQEGLLVACLEGKNVEILTKHARPPVLWYSASGNAPKADFWVKNISFGKNFTHFKVISRGQREIVSISSPLLGKHNVENVCGAVALTWSLGIKPLVIQQAVKVYQGIKTRLELVGDFGGVKIYWDFAQHPVKVKEALAALRTRHPKNKITVVFDPHQSLLQRRESLSWYLGCFDQADEVLVSRVTFAKGVPKDKRVTGNDIQMAIAQSQPKAAYLPLEEEVVRRLVEDTPKGGVIVFMSSGGQRTPRMIGNLKRRLKKKRS